MVPARTLLTLLSAACLVAGGLHGLAPATAGHDPLAPGPAATYISSWPETAAPGSTYQVCWRVVSNGFVDHTALHVDVDGRLKEETEPRSYQSGLGTTRTFCASFVAGTRQTVLQAHARHDLVDLLSAPVVVRHDASLFTPTLPEGVAHLPRYVPPGPGVPPQEERLLDALLPLAIVSAPDTWAGGTPFTACWEAYGIETLDHTDLHYEAGAFQGTTRDQSGPSPGRFCDGVTPPPVPGEETVTLFLEAHATTALHGARSAPVAVTLTTGPVYSVSLEGVPAVVSPGATLTPCTTVHSTVAGIPHIAIHHGDSPALAAETIPASTTASSARVCASITAPASGTLYVQAHAWGAPGNDVSSWLAEIPVRA
ncbi:MAG TPA: hypothetical protein VNZ52_05320 [Candidatus Thermoplasmatota archaeon]|nr:hypothetical protein [Candidatus Thermoplasmatota archaeon]